MNRRSYVCGSRAHNSVKARPNISLHGKRSSRDALYNELSEAVFSLQMNGSPTSHVPDPQEGHQFYTLKARTTTKKCLMRYLKLVQASSAFLASEICDLQPRRGSFIHSFSGQHAGISTKVSDQKWWRLLQPKLPGLRQERRSS
jgi:hypothetical protein